MSEVLQNKAIYQQGEMDEELQKPHIVLKIASVLLKVLLWTVAVLVVLFVLLAIAIQTPRMQEFVKNQAVSYLEKTLETDIEVDRLHIRFPNEVLLRGVLLRDEQKDTLFYGDRLAVHIDLLQLLDSRIKVRSVELSGVIASVSADDSGRFNYEYILDAFSSDESSPDSEPIDWAVDRIRLHDFRLQYNDPRMAKASLSFRNFNIFIESIDLEKQRIMLRTILLDDPNINLLLFPSQVDSTAVVDTTVVSSPWQVTLNRLLVNNMHLQFDQSGQERMPSGLDPNHLMISEMFLNLRDLYYSPDSISANLRQLRLKEQSGLQLNEMRAGMAMYDQGIDITDLRLRTPVTQIINDTRIRYKSIDDIVQLTNDFSIQLSLRDSYLGLSDLKLFVPDLSVLGPVDLPDRIALAAEISGNMRDAKASMQVSGAIGSADLQAAFSQSRSGVPHYTINLILDELELGQIMQIDSLDRVSLELQATGSGFEPLTASLQATGVVKEVGYNNYLFRDLDFKVDLDTGMMYVESAMNDENLHFDLTASGRMFDKIPSLLLDLNLTNANLSLLNLMEDTLIVKGHLKADIPQLDMKHPVGTIELNDLYVLMGTDEYIIDSLTIAGHMLEDEITLNLDLPRFDYAGIVLTGTKLGLETQDALVQVSLTIDQLQRGDVVLPATSLTGWLQIDSLFAQKIVTDLHLKSDKHSAGLVGRFDMNDMSFDMLLDLEALDMQSVEVFAQGMITETAGYMSGNFHLSGDTKKPNVEGVLHLHDLGFRMPEYDFAFAGINDSISMSLNEVVFRDFNIRDAQGEKLNIDGSLNITDFSNIGFDLKVATTNFKAVDSRRTAGKMFYGSLYLNTQLLIQGDVNNPQVSGQIHINPDTRFTILMPQTDPSVAGRDGIVEFVQPGVITPVDTMVIPILTNTSLRGMQVVVDISIGREAELTIIVDQSTGDYLKLKGEAELSGGIDPSGKITLTGRYEFYSGSYEMNFNLIKRKFDIKPGSYMQWSGDPMLAVLQLTALYETEASPLPLVENQLGAITATARNRYLQRLPFVTELKMQGELMKPEVTFDILLEDNPTNVAADVVSTVKTRLEQLRQQQTEMNTQVFSLLLFNQFMSENPFATGGGGGLLSTARSSAGKILTQQLNQLADNLIKGIDVDFDLEATDDYTTGERANRTDLNVALSKELFDERLKITVGSSFGLEGPEQENRDAVNLAGDFRAEYKLTADGRYRVSLFRKNEYQVALLGEIVETGVSFLITMDYDVFRELFEKDKPKKP